MQGFSQTRRLHCVVFLIFVHNFSEMMSHGGPMEGEGVCLCFLLYYHFRLKYTTETNFDYLKHFLIIIIFTWLFWVKIFSRVHLHDVSNIAYFLPCSFFLCYEKWCLMCLIHKVKKLSRSPKKCLIRAWSLSFKHVAFLCCVTAAALMFILHSVCASVYSGASEALINIYTFWKQWASDCLCAFILF